MQLTNNRATNNTRDYGDDRCIGSVRILRRFVVCRNEKGDQLIELRYATQSNLILECGKGGYVREKLYNLKSMWSQCRFLSLVYIYPKQSRKHKEKRSQFYLVHNVLLPFFSLSRIVFERQILCLILMGNLQFYFSYIYYIFFALSLVLSRSPRLLHIVVWCATVAVSMKANWISASICSVYFIVFDTKESFASTVGSIAMISHCGCIHSLYMVFVVATIGINK